MSIPRPDPQVLLSVVSHGQNALVNQLCADLKRVDSVALALVLTENIPDAVPLDPSDWDGHVEIVRNARPKGFGANHNFAFDRLKTPYFCVCNPDIRLPSDPFPKLIEALAEPSVAAAGPLVRNATGRPEDSARRFPTLGTLLRKLIWEPREPEYPIDSGPVDADWIAGMFMLFRSGPFREVGGFDEGYHLYYEDVDLCRRLRAAGYRVLYQPLTEVTHDARRESRRRFCLMLHHAQSALRFFRSTGSR